MQPLLLLLLAAAAGVAVQVEGVPVQVNPDSVVHVAEQPSPAVVFPSSQASVPSIVPFPQVAAAATTAGVFVHVEGVPVQE